MTRSVSDEVKRLAPPFVVTGNHGSKWDPFMAAVMLRHVIRYIASDSIFRRPLLRAVLHSFGAIPKKKFMSDTQAIRELFRIRSEEGIIGIFPEGHATWDGHSLSVIPATGKLCKVLGLPVVNAHFTGAYLSCPRWARFFRRGRLHVSFSLLLSGEDVRRLGPDEISEKIAAGLEHDEMDAQKKNPVMFNGRRRAEYLENTLFICPSCTAMVSLVSSGHEFFCTECGYHVYYDRSARFVPVPGETGSVMCGDIREWNLFQTVHLSGRYSELGAGEELFSDHVTLNLARDSGPFEVLDSGRLSLHKGVICFRGKVHDYDFGLSGLQGVTIQTGEKLEFYWHDPESGKLVLVWPDFGSLRVSALKWYMCWQIENAAAV